MSQILLYKREYLIVINTYKKHLKTQTQYMNPVFLSKLINFLK